MNMRNLLTLTCIGLLSWLSAPAAAFIIDDFSVSDPAGGFTLDLDDSEILESHLETGLPNGNVFGGARYVQLDWQGIPAGQGPFPGDSGQVKVNLPGPGEVGRMNIVGDSRFSFNYGRAAGIPHAFGPFDWTATDILKVTLAASVSEDLIFGMFLWGDLFGRTQLWASAPFSLLAGNTETTFDLPNATTFTAYDTSNNPHTVTVGDLLEHTTGLTTYWKGWDNSDTVGAFDIEQIEMIGPGCTKIGDLDGDCDVDDEDIDILCANMGGDPDDFDFDGDNDVDEDDLIFLIENLVELQDGSGRVGTKRGDFNLDGLVNATDLAIMKPNFGFSPRMYSQGNANCDTVVNATDLAILKLNFGFTAPTGVIPEPASLILIGLGGLGLLRRRR